MTAPQLLDDKRFRLVASLRLAAADMAITTAGATRLAEGTEQSDVLRQALMTGTIVSYARPWTESRGAAFLFPLDKKAPQILQEILPAAGTDERSLHDTIVRKLRPQVYAHTDPGGGLRDIPGDIRMILTFGPGALTEMFPELRRDSLERIARLADAQRRRFWSTIVRLGDDLRDEHGVSEIALLDPSTRCAGCPRPVGPEGRYYSEGLSFAAYCPECASREFH